MIYMDNAATTKVSDAAMTAMLPYFQEMYGNASSIHTAGEQAAEAVINARNRIATLLRAKPEEIYFTSGGTEADNWAIRSAAAHGEKYGKKHIISSAFEHHAVLHTLTTLEKSGFEVTLLPVHSDGLVRSQELRAAIREDTCLVTIMYANNEIGTVQPIRELASVCFEHEVTFHTDAVQAIGHLDVDVRELNVDMLSLSAHKFHGPKGIGALYCRKGNPLSIMIEGGAQERGKRGGTENVPGIVGMAAALNEAYENMEEHSRAVTAMRDELVASLSKIPRSHHNGDAERSLPGIVNFCFEGIEGEAMLLLLDAQGICASSGSACTSGSLDPSHVLLALGLPHAVAHGSLRLSLSEYNTKEEIETVIEKLPPIIQRLRDMSPVWEQLEKESKNGI